MCRERKWYRPIKFFRNLTGYLWTSHFVLRNFRRKRNLTPSKSKKASEFVVGTFEFLDTSWIEGCRNSQDRLWEKLQKIQTFTLQELVRRKKILFNSNTRHRLAKDTCKEAVLYNVSQDEKLEQLKSIFSILLMHKNKLLTF